MLKRQEETRRKGFGKRGSRMQQRSAGEEYGWKANYGAKANGGTCFTSGKSWKTW